VASLPTTDRKEIRKFGIIAFFFFGCLSALGIWLKKPLPLYLFGFLSFLGLCFILLPSPLTPVYRLWLKVANFLGKVVTTVLLALGYYFVITPSAFIKRLFGGPPLPLKPDKNRSSYWVTRTEAAQPKERFIKRY
jgi:hypothetical protein